MTPDQQLHETPPRPNLRITPIDEGTHLEYMRQFNVSLHLWDKLSASMDAYKTAIWPLVEQNFLRSAYESNCERFGEDSERAQNVKSKLMDDQAMHELKEEESRARLIVADELNIKPEDTKMLYEAYKSECYRRSQCRVIEGEREDGSKYNWYDFEPAMWVPDGISHGEFAKGVITMAKLTDQSYGVHVSSDYASGFYLIRPGDTIEDLFPELRFGRWSWPLLRKLKIRPV